MTGDEPAFPVSGILYNAKQTRIDAPGITHRQWLEGILLQGIVSSDWDWEPQEAAEQARKFAAALLAAENVKGEGK